MPDTTSRQPERERVTDDAHAEGKDGTWLVPPTDIHETDEAFLVFLDMPGVAPDAVSLRAEEDELIVTAATEGAPAGETEIRAEFETAGYHRHLGLPDIIDRERIDAAFQNGVLVLTLPKVEAVKPRTIEIRVE